MNDKFQISKRRPTHFVGPPGLVEITHGEAISLRVNCSQKPFTPIIVLFVKNLNMDGGVTGTTWIWSFASCVEKEFYVWSFFHKSTKLICTREEEAA